MKTCFFTGHRTIGRSDYDMVTSYVRAEILEKINAGVRVFIAGGARGFDTLAAEQVIDMRERYPEVQLHLYLPCNDQEEKWEESDKERYQRILKAADRIFYVTDSGYQKGCMQKRNRAMVNDSDCGIAYMLRNGSGSSQTVRLAEEKGLDIVNISEYIKILQG